VDGNKIKGTNTLNHGVVIKIEITFEGNEATVRSETKNVTLEIKLEKM